MIAFCNSVLALRHLVGYKESNCDGVFVLDAS